MKDWEIKYEPDNKRGEMWTATRNGQVIKRSSIKKLEATLLSLFFKDTKDKHHYWLSRRVSDE